MRIDNFKENLEDLSNKFRESPLARKAESSLNKPEYKNYDVSLAKRDDFEKIDTRNLNNTNDIEKRKALNNEEINNDEQQENNSDIDNNSIGKDATDEYPCCKEVDGKKYYYDDNGELYRVDADLLPNHEYEINGYKYETDEKGRIISAEGQLRIKDREGRLPIRDSLEDIGKGDEKENDDRGHLIGDQFDGSNGLENLIPQDAEINRKDYKNLENELAEAVKEGKEVYVKVEPIYEGDSRRPSEIVVTYTIDGKENVRVFPNSKEGE